MMPDPNQTWRPITIDGRQGQFMAEKQWTQKGEGEQVWELTRGIIAFAPASKTGSVGEMPTGVVSSKVGGGERIEGRDVELNRIIREAADQKNQVGTAQPIEQRNPFNLFPTLPTIDSTGVVIALALVVGAYLWSKRGQPTNE